MIHKRPSPCKRKIVVVFEIPNSIWAECINLVGDFNQWDCESLPFRQDHHENWQVEIELEAGCEYRFRYLFDGRHWLGDWHADKSLPNAQGGYDSIVVAAMPTIA